LKRWHFDVFRGFAYRRVYMDALKYVNYSYDQLMEALDEMIFEMRIAGRYGYIPESYPILMAEVDTRLYRLFKLES
jgi:hypothetical protein